MTEEQGLVPIPGTDMALPAELAAELDALAQTGEELGGTLLDMLAIYSKDGDRWKTGETKKDSLVGIYLCAATQMRTFWPVDAPMGKTPPSCWSMGGEDAVPHEASGEPQHDTCEGCPWNEFETAKQGKGKACKTKRADFIVEIDESKLTQGDNGTWVVDPDAVLGIAMIRSSATAKETRRSIGQWAKDVRSARGIPQLVLTRWGLTGSVSSGGTDFYAPTMTSMGTYSCDPESLEEIVQTAKDLREGQMEEILVTLAGKQDTEEEES